MGTQHLPGHRRPSGTLRYPDGTERPLERDEAVTLYGTGHREPIHLRAVDYFTRHPELVGLGVLGAALIVMLVAG